VSRRPVPAPEQLPRLVPADGPLNLARHIDRYGPVPFRGYGGPRGWRRGVTDMLIATVERSGLTGRGGAGFPAAKKMRAVADRQGRRSGFLGSPAGSVVVANGVESEPASGKDAVLLNRAPHLVLDGIQLAAEAVGAGEAYLCVAGEDERLIRRLAVAVSERERAGLSQVSVEVMPVYGSYVASEESALVNYLNEGPAVPVFVPPRPFERGVRGRPTLVNNVETLAHIALIARYGPMWFAAIGTPDAPGSALVTVGGGVQRPGVYEIPLGMRMGDLIRLAGGLAERAQAILAGGYFGGWLPLPDAMDAPVSGPGLRALGAGLGSGIIVVLPESACGLAETARVVRYLGTQSAGQCGPCLNGVPAIADVLEHITWERADERSIRWAGRLLPLVEGRGACHFPDGPVAMARSALRVFSSDLRYHQRRGPCPGTRHRPVLPVPQAARPPGGQETARDRGRPPVGLGAR
jgi:NADH:ubiquinone oxidoreductase subunit F (NADH-binding)